MGKGNSWKQERDEAITDRHTYVCLSIYDFQILSQPITDHVLCSQSIVGWIWDADLQIQRADYGTQGSIWFWS